MSIVLAISLAVLAAFGARRLWQRVPDCQRAGPPYSAALVLAAAVDVWPALELHRVWWRAAARSTTRVAGQPVVLAEFPTQPQHSASSPTAVPFMYFSIWHWLPMINGYSGFTPPSYEPLMEGLQRFPGAGDDRSAAGRAASRT